MQRGHLAVGAFQLFKADVLYLKKHTLLEAGDWLFAQKPLEAPNHPKPPQTPKFPENPVFPRNPPKIPTEFIWSAIQKPAEIPWIFANFLEITQISGPRMGDWIRRGWIWRFWGSGRKIGPPKDTKSNHDGSISRKSGEERNSRKQPQETSRSHERPKVARPCGKQGPRGLQRNAR